MGDQPLDLAAYLRQRLADHYTQGMRRGEAWSFVFHAAAIAAERVVVVHEPVRDNLAMIHVASLFLMVFVVAWERHRPSTVDPWYFPVSTTYVAPLLYAIAAYATGPYAEPSALLRTWIAVASLSVVLVLVCPYGGRIPVIAGAYISLLTAIVWAYLGQDPAITIINGVLLIGVGFFQSGVAQKRIAEWTAQHRAEADAARHAREKVARELELARAIQDSMTPQAITIAGTTEARCYQLKHDEVGGDWIAVRMVGDDLVTMVVDASGKGMQAALVIHAVQALWAESLAEPDFAPAAWLARVNHALWRMSAKEAHTVTAGLLVVRKDEAVYWSAGHVPLFVVETGKPTHKAIFGTGGILGMNADFAIKPVTIPLAGVAKLFLASDGVFDKGGRHRRKELDALEESLATAGEKALAALPADDDKSLVLVTVGVQSVDSQRAG